eukprot:1907951-Amphidinium_carterae.1
MPWAVTVLPDRTSHPMYGDYACEDHSDVDILWGSRQGVSQMFPVRIFPWVHSWNSHLPKGCITFACGGLSCCRSPASARLESLHCEGKCMD